MLLLREVVRSRTKRNAQKRENFFFFFFFFFKIFYFASLKESVFVLFLSESNAFCSLLVFVIRERRRRKRHREKTK